MSIEEEYQSYGVVHGINDQVCKEVGTKKQSFWHKLWLAMTWYERYKREQLIEQGRQEERRCNR